MEADSLVGRVARRPAHSGGRCLWPFCNLLNKPFSFFFFIFLCSFNVIMGPSPQYLWWSSCLDALSFMALTEEDFPSVLVSLMMTVRQAFLSSCAQCPAYEWCLESVTVTKLFRTGCSHLHDRSLTVAMAETYIQSSRKYILHLLLYWLKKLVKYFVSWLIFCQDDTSWSYLEKELQLRKMPLSNYG